MKFDYTSKLIDIDKALSLVRPGDNIVTGLAAAEARVFFMRLHEITPHLEGSVTVTNCLPMADGDYLKPEYSRFFDIDSWFFTGQLRNCYKNGNVSFIPNHLHLAGTKRLQYAKPSIYIGNATPPDKHGYLSLSLSNTYEKRMIAEANLVILEINNNLPRTYGDVEIHLRDVDYVIETDYAVPEIPDAQPSETDYKIGRLIADQIEDGDCIQLGIGGMPNAIAKSLYNKKHLGVHTEMLTSEMAKLSDAGVIDGSRKTLLPGKMVCTFVLGTRQLYDFADGNPALAVLDGAYVNDPYVIGKNKNQVSINTSIEVDLFGQCASESVGVRQISGTGGQADTAIGAQLSEGGRSYIALYSTATVKDADGNKQLISKIVPRLNHGAAVSLSRSDVDRVVTEFGIAELRGTGTRERVERLCAIAHPDFREQIMREAYDIGLIYRRIF